MQPTEITLQDAAALAGYTYRTMMSYRFQDETFPKPTRRVGSTNLFSAEAIKKWAAARRRAKPNRGFLGRAR